MSSIRLSLLDNLVHSLINVMGSCHPYLNEEECDNKLKPAIRRILLQKALGERALLAISGTQGAGKTTLIKNLYGLSDEDAKWFQANQGRGEKHPILITEHLEEQIEGIIKVFTKGPDGNRTLKAINLREKHSRLEDAQAEFCRAAADRDNNAGEVMLELRLPPRLNLGKDRGWVLLPGYEKSDGDSQSWQDTMSAVAVNAYGAVIVTDEKRLAGDQATLIRDTNMSHLDDMQPIVVVTRTEDKSEESCQELRERASKIFSVESNRVVCSGSKDDPAYMKKWQDTFKDTAENFIGEEGRGGGNTRSLTLAKLINSDLRTALAGIKRDVSDKVLVNEVDDPTEKWVEKLMETFDEAEEKFRRRYERDIRNAIEDNAAGVQEAVLKNLASDHEGVVRHTVNFFKSDTKQLLELQDIVKKNVSKAEQNKPLGQAVSQAIHRRLHRVLGGSAKDIGMGLLPYEKGGDPDKEDTPSFALVTLYKNDDQKVGKIEGLEKAVEALPALATNFALRLSQFEPLQKEIRGSVEGWTGERSVSTINVVQHIADNLGDATEQATKAYGILKDFTKNLGTKGPSFQGGLLGAIVGTVGAEAAGSAMLGGGPLTLAAGGIFAAGYLGAQLVQEAKATDRANRTTALEMFEKFKQNRFDLYMESYEELMETTRENFRAQLQKRYKILDKIGKKDRAFRSIAIAQELREKLHEELSTDLHVA